MKWEDPRSFRTPRIARMLPTSHMEQHTAKHISPQLQGIGSLPSDDLSSCHSWGTTGSKCESITLQGKLMAGPQSLIKQQSATQHTRTLRESRLCFLLNGVSRTRDIRVGREILHLACQLPPGRTGSSSVTLIFTITLPSSHLPAPSLLDFTDQISVLVNTGTKLTLFTTVSTSDPILKTVGRQVTGYYLKKITLSVCLSNPNDN